MAVGLVAFTILILASTVTASYPVGPWQSGAHASFYGLDNGNDGAMGSACGHRRAIFAEFYGTQNAALSGALFQVGRQCGACFEVQCDGQLGWCILGKSVVVTATNFCPAGSWGGWCDTPREHFDLSVPAFTTIINKVAGPYIPIQYRRVPCQKQGGIRFFIQGHPFFQMVQIYNVGGAGNVKSVSIKGAHTAWSPMRRNWGVNWLWRSYLVGQEISFSVTTFDDRNVVSSNAANRDWQYGMTFQGSNFE